MRFVIQIEFLHDGFWVNHQRIRYTYQYNCSCCIIRKIKTLTKLSTTHCKNDSSFSALYVLIECWYNKLIMWAFPWLLVYSFNFFHFFYYFVFFPVLIMSFQHVVRREENENASRSYLTESNQCDTKILLNCLLFSKFVRKVKSSTQNTPCQNTNFCLRIIDNMFIFNSDRKIHQQLLLKRFHRT